VIVRGGGGARAIDVAEGGKWRGERERGSGSLTTTSRENSDRG
jgi:hypothetical protein